MEGPLKKSAIVLFALLAAQPAHAGLLTGANLIKVAEVVLKGKALLGKGQAQCGSALALGTQDNLLITAATAAVKQQLPAPKFKAMDILAGKQANVAAASPTFCQTTAAAKPGILGGIADAAGKLGVNMGGLGGLGSVIGSATTTGTQSSGGVLGGILGN
jgi:hypothetical protein